MKDTTFKMTGFPQHAGVSPMKQDKPNFLEKKNRGPVEPKKAEETFNESKYGQYKRKSLTTSNAETTESKTKLGKWLKKHKVKDKLTNVKNKIEKFASSDTGKAVLAGIADKATTPRPKKEITAIIQGEQKSIM